MLKTKTVSVLVVTIGGNKTCLGMQLCNRTSVITLIDMMQLI